MVAVSSQVAASIYYEYLTQKLGPRVIVLISGTKDKSSPLNDLRDQFNPEEPWIEKFKMSGVDELALLVVVDKYLTGFDAPIVRAMYLDKPLTEHNLLQAIARVNRPMPEKGKEWGLTIGITDMHLCFLRNETDYPFLFSDAPVVFYNTWAWDVRNRGVLGVQCPGLQIFYPLSPKITAMLIDADRYAGPWSDSIVLDVHHRADVSQLNALQVHHAMSTIYFADSSDASYVHDLWSAHRSRLAKLQSIYTDKSEFWIDEKPPEGDLMHMFEPQVNHPLSLSFVDCQRIREHEYVYGPRNQEIHDELKSHNN